jgi:hypothetical protein
VDESRVRGNGERDERQAPGAGSADEDVAELGVADPIDDLLREQGAEAAAASARTSQPAPKLVRVVPGLMRHRHARHELALLFRDNVEIPGIGKSIGSVVNAVEWQRIVRVDALGEVGERASVCQTSTADNQTRRRACWLRVCRVATCSAILASTPTGVQRSRHSPLPRS